MFAVDDVLLLAGKIPDQFEGHICDFDTPQMCGYTQASDTDVQWKWRNGLDSIAAKDTGPRLDKSQNSPQGMLLSHCIQGFYSAFSLLPSLRRMENDSFSFAVCS